ncbi:nucleotide pyrophosphatase [Tritrichomonas foetus]|uniref:Nucleotide pyrophosphatase n=1 Tax=Tritrichomonas foetus TaxID=1144522 RepID=A0A1J4K9Q6_9EUKA|nr:nucleotide pyrophosphatase [Tritrichomonas foetus]|eukprot:OHT07682.1 nucleotide pyrophosphatase [Tritrichomonas foetus]
MKHKILNISFAINTLILLCCIYGFCVLTLLDKYWVDSYENSAFFQNKTNLVNRAIILGIDGAGNLFNAEAPNIRNLMKNGIYTLNGKSVMPTISAECWGSIFYSVPPKTHKLTNHLVESRNMSNPSITSLFKLTRQNFPDSEIYSYATWKAFDIGFFENYVFNEIYARFNDSDVIQQGINCIKNKNPKLLFMYLGDVDRAGHHHVYQSEKYYQVLNDADKSILSVLQAMNEKHYFDDSLIIILSDHGGKGKRHGLGIKDMINVFFTAYSPHFPANMEISNYSIIDVSKIVAVSLGMAVPDDWIGKYPQELTEYFREKQRKFVEKSVNDYMNSTFFLSIFLRMKTFFNLVQIKARYYYHEFMLRSNL